MAGSAALPLVTRVDIALVRWTGSLPLKFSKAPAIVTELAGAARGSCWGGSFPFPAHHFFKRATGSVSSGGDSQGSIRAASGTRVWRALLAAIRTPRYEFVR